MGKSERIIGWIGAILVLMFGKTVLGSDMLFFRLLVGIGFGYALSRSYSGFAGSVNRAVRTGSTKLMRTLMGLFLAAGLITTAFVFSSEPGTYNLFINPINLGLIFGAILFGFGMSFSSCCASGVFTDLVTGLPRAIITLIFFSLGAFIAYPVGKLSIVSHSWFSTATGAEKSGGVFFPDLFQGDGVGGYLGALILTGILCGIVVLLSYLYEKSRKQNKTYTGVLVENIQEKQDDFDSKDFKVLSESTYYRAFIKPWSLAQGFGLMAAMYALLLGVTKSGWGVSGPFAIWAGKFFILLGISPEAVSSYSTISQEALATPFFQNAVTIQNIGILLGTLLFLLMAGDFTKMFKTELKITGKQAGLFALGGLAMGIGTRFAKGCNAGGLFTPVANFSLSGWVFLVCMVVGGLIGNTLAKKWSHE